MVSRGKHVIGTLSRKTLREAVASSPARVDTEHDALPLALVATLGDVIGGLARLLVPAKSGRRGEAP